MVWRKLKSNTGASIIMALLLFLVCAVIGAVVLTAGTAASGRVSGLTEMDQRYYAVSSAAELLAREIKGKTVTIVRERRLEEQTGTRYLVTKVLDENGDWTGEETETPETPVKESSESSYHLRVNTTEFPANDGSGNKQWALAESGITVTADDVQSFLTKLAVELMFRRGPSGSYLPYNTESAMNYGFSGGSAGGKLALKPKNNDSGEDLEALYIEGSYELKTDGTLVLLLEQDGFQIELRFQPKVSDTGLVTSTPRITGTDVSYFTNSDDYKVTQTTETIYSRETTIEWKLSGLRKVTAVEEQTGGGTP